MSYLEVKNLSYVYAKGTPMALAALNNVSFSANKGEIIGLIGHTGSGKSTLVQHLNGLIKAEKGHIFLDGKDIWENPKEIRKIRFKVGLVFQYPEYQLFEETVKKDIAFGPENMGLKSDDVEKRVLRAAEAVGLKNSLLDKSPFDLSGGEKRRAAIAGVIAMEPNVLILDEPCAGLDPKGRNEILSMIKDYKDKTNALIIIVSHSMEDMAKVADRLVVMNDGEIALTGTKEEVFSSAEILTSIGLDIPQITKIMFELKKRGYSVNQAAFTVESAFNSIMSVSTGRKSNV